MIEAARRNMDIADTVRVLNEDTGLSSFNKLQKKTLWLTVRLYLWGARHFSERSTEGTEHDTTLPVETS